MNSRSPFGGRRALPGTGIKNRCSQSKWARIGTLTGGKMTCVENNFVNNESFVVKKRDTGTIAVNQVRRGGGSTPREIPNHLGAPEWSRAAPTPRLGSRAARSEKAYPTNQISCDSFILP